MLAPPSNHVMSEENDVKEIRNVVEVNDDDEFVILTENEAFQDVLGHFTTCLNTVSEDVPADEIRVELERFMKHLNDHFEASRQSTTSSLSLTKAAGQTVYACHNVYTWTAFVLRILRLSPSSLPLPLSSWTSKLVLTAFFAYCSGRR